LILAQASLAVYEKALGKKIHTEVKPLSESGPFYYAHEEFQQYLARPFSRPYCSAEPQGVSLPPFINWSPAELLNSLHAPKLDEDFWTEHAPKPHCVVRAPNEQIVYGPKNSL